MNMFESFLWKKSPEKVEESYPTVEGMEVKEMTVDEVEAIGVAGDTGENIKNNSIKAVFKVGRDLDDNPGTIEWQDPDTIIGEDEDVAPWLQGRRDDTMFNRENRDQR